MALLDDIHRAQELAQEKAKEAQEKAIEAARDAQEILRDAQEKALELARERANEARERARRATEAMPPGLLVRILSSVAGIPLLVFLVFAEGAPEYAALPFTGAVAICALLGGYEYFKGLRLRGFMPTEGLAYVGITLLQLAAWSVSRGRFTYLLPALLALLVIATLIHQVLRRNPEPIANIGATFIGVIYVGWLFSYLIFLRSLPGPSYIPIFGELARGVQGTWLETLLLAVANAPRGAWLVLYVFAVTWITDTGAYFVGMRWGKHPLAPRLSPKKTIEGAIGGLIAATAMSLAWGTWINLPWLHCLILGPVLGVLAQVGDLCESAIKRDLGIKDFGTLLPGHGGILDRFDSLLFTAPIAYYYLVMIAPRLP
jgi:phosphatidate cytidylyltransferase